MQTVLITGAASGIGRDTARRFASAGWQCVLVDQNAQALGQLGASLPAPASAPHVLRCIDLTDAAQVASLGEGMPALDAVLNNAGMSDASNTPLAEQGPAHTARLLALNLAAPAAVVDACARWLKPGARVVNVASGAGLHAIPWRGAYSPSKAGLIAQTRALARARPDWCVTVLCPGFVRTELVAGLIEAGRLKPEGALAKIPLGRMAAPEEMARALQFLASADAAPLHGQMLALDGGSSIYGGSQPLPAATLAPLPLDTPMELEVRGGDDTAWHAIAPPQPTAQPCYDACLDLSPLHAPAAGLLEGGACLGGPLRRTPRAAGEPDAAAARGGRRALAGRRRWRGGAHAGGHPGLRMGQPRAAHQRAGGAALVRRAGAASAAALRLRG
jgi:NAD(P)-dependent dehydrogenase (short-subunit alcohol dehydrogenase family)